METLARKEGKESMKKKQELERRWAWARFALLVFLIFIVTEIITRILFVELFPIAWWSYIGACITVGNVVSFLIAVAVILLISAKLNTLKKVV